MMKYKRKPSIRREKNKIIISCEDSNEGASYKYFDLIIKKFNLEKKIQIIDSKKKSTPLSVAKRAEKAYFKGDEVFIVLDKDEHNHEDAKQFLKDSKIQDYYYIMSNPCFEYWLLLHEQLTNKSFDCSKGLCKELGKVLEKQGKKYYKTMDYRCFIDSIKIKKATEYSKNNYKKEFNPSTNMHILIGLLNLNNKIYK